ncbi:SseB family protein [Campylobacter sp. RM9344]|uniref:SseB family protein n=1 Tax=Campylobacter californiensis TaxID=1032243 RepID=A0AAW3ZSQ6_9BACT|nr:MULTISPECIES: SseB family protein [unclassified Campylobacter]MBE2984441.1 SseB family protein [Campylobacter sp. RM6883]MBE2985780.1 SseB family protein [Campylobacter sp. RM12919]MBE2987895.1 SseB family protein [Campylobacter sp. RM12920]MBE2995029.1 SseB family protein [Campylobacter sp. RM6913]MBE3028880.1 SseB family protein [Campylobacter sp. RM9344]
MSLIKAIENFKNEPTKDNEICLINELKKAEFLAPVILAAPLAKPDGSAVYEEEGSNIKFALLSDDENDKSYFPAFTSRQELMKWRNDSEQEVINLRLKDYGAILLDDKNNYEGIVIDAFSHSLILDLNFFRAIFKD